MSEFISIHLFFVYILVFLEILYFVFSQYIKDIHKYIFRIRVLLPAYYTIIACVFFTGILLEAMKGFNDFRFLMLFGLILILAISIFQFIKFKKYRRSKEYVKFKKLSLFLELAKLLIMIGLFNVLLFF